MLFRTCTNGKILTVRTWPKHISICANCALMSMPNSRTVCYLRRPTNGRRTRRLAPLLENSRRKIELLNTLLFSMRGTPIIYYGDEIGMGDNFYLGDRNGCRTPMQWSPDRNAGFSRANPQQLYLPVTIDPEYH